MLKMLNPIIWAWNIFKYMAHIESYRDADYEPYDFKEDTKYF